VSVATNTSDQAELARALRSEAAKAVKETERRFKAQHPDAAHLKVRADIVAYKPRGKEQREAPYRTVALLLSEPKLVNQSNKEVIAALIRATGIKVPASILTEPFVKRVRERLSNLLADRKISLDLSEHNTPSKVKLALRAHRAGKDAASRKTVTFAFTTDTIVVDDKAYPIHGEGRLRRIDVRSKKLNADALRRLILGED
jgi:hypothetical protein